MAKQTVEDETPEMEESNDGRRMTKGEVVDKIEKLGKSGNHDDVMKACKFAIEFVKRQGAEDPYEVAVGLINDSAVPVPGTKTIWTERRLREFVDLGVRRPGL